MRTARRGFTLSELLVGLVVTSIVLTAVAAIFIGVQRSYQAETESRVVTENGRGALLFLERTLPLAGYGLDPRVAFDVSLTQANDNQDVRSVTFTPSQPALTGAANTIVTDDLAFRYRDPMFLRAGRLNAGNTTITLDQSLPVALPLNKLLMVGCRGGSEYAMVRVATAAAAGASSITVANAGAPFVANAASCLTGTGAETPWVFLVHEHRLKIVNLGGRPWLVSFRDLTASTTALGDDNFDPIAPDVEVFQVAFGMARARPGLGCCQTAIDVGGNTNFVVGDALGETFFAQPGSVLSAPPDFRTGYDQPTRYSAHPANIRSVHVALVLRSSRTSPSGRTFEPAADLFNWDATVTARDRFQRSLFHTAINTPNTLSRSQFIPALRSSADLRDLNSWGG